MPAHRYRHDTLDTHDAPFFALGAVFFRRSRLFFREAAFSSGGEGCEWGAKQPTVSNEWGYNGENSFSALSPFAGSRKGFSPHIPAPDFLFSSIHPKPPFHSTPFAGQYTRLLKERGGENAPGFHNPGAHRFWKYKLFSISLKPSIQ